MMATSSAGDAGATEGAEVEGGGEEDDIAALLGWGDPPHPLEVLFSRDGLVRSLSLQVDPETRDNSTCP
jgi:hypothetical protein